jgi:hypothetical protein
MDGSANQDKTNNMTVHHNIAITLLPETSELKGRDRIRIHGLPSDRIKLLLAPVHVSRLFGWMETIATTLF